MSAEIGCTTLDALLSPWQKRKRRIPASLIEDLLLTAVSAEAAEFNNEKTICWTLYPNIRLSTAEATLLTG